MCVYVYTVYLYICIHTRVYTVYAYIVSYMHKHTRAYTLCKRVYQFKKDKITFKTA